MPVANFTNVETEANQLFSTSTFLQKVSTLSQDQLANIDTYLQSLLISDSDLLKKTHYFHDRYENLYLKDHNQKDLTQLIEEALSLCAELLHTEIEALSISYWFNLMGPGHVTTLHRHDDWDELISGVVYLTVPEHSGNLVLQKTGQLIEIEPRSGHYIFFDPSTPHAVKENKSQQHRLSIGMNIGLKTGLRYSE